MREAWVKRQCPECQYWFAAKAGSLEPRCQDCLALGTRPDRSAQFG